MRPTHPHVSTLLSLSRTFPFDGGGRTTRREAFAQLRTWLYLEVQGGCIRYWPLFHMCTVEVHGVGGTPQARWTEVLHLIQQNYIRLETVGEYEEVGVDEVELLDELTDDDIIDSEPTFTQELFSLPPPRPSCPSCTYYGSNPADCICPRGTTISA